MAMSSKLMLTSRVLASIQSRGLASVCAPAMNQEQAHPRIQAKAMNEQQQQQKPGDYMLPHEIYTEKELQEVKITHKSFESWHDRVAYGAVRTLRFFFDVFTGYVHADSKHSTKTMTEQQWLRRFIFLESVAGVPGMVGGMSRHMKSLRKHINK